MVGDMDGMLVTGQAQTRSDAIAAVEKAIDKAIKAAKPKEPPVTIIKGQH